MKNVKTGHTVPVVCLDAGHYGKYNRSPAVPEFWESEFNWRFHLLLKAALEKYGMEVRTTRADAGQDLGLVDRGRASEGCDLFLSIHANAAGTESADYPLVIAQIDGRGDTLAVSLSDTIRSVMDTTQPGQVWHKPNTAGTADWYGVLRGAAAVGTVGLILEHGFYTNTRSARWLLVEENLSKLAEAEAAVIAEWFDVELSEDKPRSTVTLTLPVIYPKDKGPHVRAMQALLIGYGYSCGPCGVDGSNGPETQRALVRYQSDHNLEPDCHCGPATWGCLMGV